MFTAVPKTSSQRTGVKATPDGNSTPAATIVADAASVARSRETFLRRSDCNYAAIPMTLDCGFMVDVLVQRLGASSC